MLVVEKKMMSVFKIDVCRLQLQEPRLVQYPLWYLRLLRLQFCPPQLGRPYLVCPVSCKARCYFFFNWDPCCRQLAFLQQTKESSY
jgi:hypothetical protein